MCVSLESDDMGMSTSRNILLVISKMGKGGAQQIVLDLACGMVARGVNVDILLLYRTPQDKTVLANLDPRVGLKYLYGGGLSLGKDHGSLLRRFFYLFEIPFFLFKWIWRGELERYDIIHCNLLVGSYIGNLIDFGVGLLRKRRPVFVETFHADFMSLSKVEAFCFRFSWRHLDCLVTELVRSDFEKLSAVREKGSVCHIPFGVGPPASAETEVTANFWGHWGCEEGIPVIVTVSRLNNREKRVDRLLECVAELKKSYGGNFRYLLCGDGPDSDALKQLAAKLEIDEQVAFVGYVDFVAVPLSQAALFLVAGIEDLIGIAGLQAASMGVPVVSFQVESDTVKRNKFFWASPSPQEVAREMSCLLEDAQYHKASAERGLRLVKEEFSVATMIERYDNLYSSLLNKAVPWPGSAWRKN
jgi:glycosyltransferase involved in cell wall biosynthesis